MTAPPARHDAPDPVRDARRAEDRWRSSSAPLPRRRAARLLEHAGGVVNQHWPSLEAVFVVAALPVFGKFTAALDLPR